MKRVHTSWRLLVVEQREIALLQVWNITPTLVRHSEDEVDFVHAKMKNCRRFIRRLTCRRACLRRYRVAGRRGGLRRSRRLCRGLGGRGGRCCRLLCRRRKQGKCGRKHEAVKISDHSSPILSITRGLARNAFRIIAVIPLQSRLPLLPAGQESSPGQQAEGSPAAITCPFWGGETRAGRHARSYAPAVAAPALLCAARTWTAQPARPAGPSTGPRLRRACLRPPGARWKPCVHESDGCDRFLCAPAPEGICQ